MEYELSNSMRTLYREGKQDKNKLAEYHDKVFMLFRMGNVHYLVIALTPWLEDRARGALLDVGARNLTNSWREDMISEAQLYLYKLLARLMERLDITSGRHLLNTMRKSIRKKMLKAYHERHVIAPPYSTVLKRLAKSEEAMSPEEGAGMQYLDSRAWGGERILLRWCSIASWAECNRRNQGQAHLLKLVQSLAHPRMLPLLAAFCWPGYVKRGTKERRKMTITSVAKELKLPPSSARD